MATAVPPHNRRAAETLQRTRTLRPAVPLLRPALVVLGASTQPRLACTMATRSTPVTEAGCNVSHCIPASMAPWAQRLVIRKKSGNRTGLEITFKERCPTRDKPREEVKATFKKGLTVERDLLPKLRKKLDKYRKGKAIVKEAGCLANCEPRPEVTAKCAHRASESSKVQGKPVHACID